MPMNRRNFLSSSLRAAVAGSLGLNTLAKADSLLTPSAPDVTIVRRPNLDRNRHRFGVNYTPSKNWWFCWNDWDAGSIARALDAIAALGADHLRIMLVWPFFQP